MGTSLLSQSTPQVIAPQEPLEQRSELVPHAGRRNQRRHSWCPGYGPSSCSTASGILANWACLMQAGFWNKSCGPRSNRCRRWSRRGGPRPRWTSTQEEIDLAEPDPLPAGHVHARQHSFAAADQEPDAVLARVDEHAPAPPAAVSLERQPPPITTELACLVENR